MSITIRKRVGVKGSRFQAIIRSGQDILKTKTFSKKSLAMEWAKRIETDKEHLLALGNKSQSIRFNELAEEYLEQWAGRSKGHQAVRLKFWEDHFGEVKVIDIQSDNIREGLNILGKTKTNSTVNRYRTVLSGCMTYATHEQYIPRNPVSLTRTKPVNNRRVRFLSEDERRALLEAAKNSSYPRMYLLIILSLTTGCRKSEMLNMRWSDVDFNRKTVAISVSKTDEPRVIPLTSSVFDELTQFREVGNGFIFPSTISAKKPFYLRREWDRIRRVASLENFVFHDLRHTAASYLAMNDVSLNDIAEILGHRSIETTRRYAHLSTEYKANVVSRVLEEKIKTIH